MWKPTLEMTGIKCLRTGTLKPRWNYFFQIKKTLPKFLKDEIKKKKKRTGSGQFTEQMKLTTTKCGSSRWLPSALITNPFWDSAGQGNSKNHVLRPFLWWQCEGGQCCLRTTFLLHMNCPIKPHKPMNQHAFWCCPTWHYSKRGWELVLRDGCMSHLRKSLKKSQNNRPKGPIPTRNVASPLQMNGIL
jgi:hypothetical protein